MKIEETLQLAAETAGIGTWHLSVAENELRCSPRCKEVLGFSPDAPFRYDDFLSVIHPEDRPLVEAAIARAQDPKGSGLYESDYRILHPDRTVRWIGSRGKVFFEERNGVRVAIRFIGTVLDRTEHRNIQNALIEAERLAVTGRLAASIAHEIRNPVDGVMNLLYLLRTESSEEKRSRYIQEAEGELSRVAEIATNTLRFYQDPADATTFDLAEVTGSVLKLFGGHIARCRVTVETSLPHAILVSAPRGQLRQVISNLVSNALDAMPAGGRLILRARHCMDKRTGKRCVHLAIADTGKGMAPEVVSRIFESFYTTKGAAGNGLGLWLSFEILKKCHSSIRVRSAAGRGSVFRLFLPGALPES